VPPSAMAISSFPSPVKSAATIERIWKGPGNENEGSKVPSPRPRKRDSAAPLEEPFAVSRSIFPSPLKSPAASATGSAPNR